MKTGCFVLENERDPGAEWVPTCPQCPAVLCGCWCSLGQGGCVSWGGWNGLPTQSESRGTLESQRLQGFGREAMGWEWAERPGPPSCPYSAMPVTEQPYRAACHAASGLDHSCAGSSVCAASSALKQFFQLCPRGSFWWPVRWCICAARQFRVGW